MKPIIYFDNSATTKPCKEAVEAANYAMCEKYYNPSSLYFMGMEAENILTETRKTVAEELSCKEEEIIFTSCGSESNNTAIFSFAENLKKRGRHIVTTSVEHPSVLEAIKVLEEKGYEITKVKPEKDGNILEENILSAIRKDTILVSVMLVNNETGAIFPLKNIKKEMQKKGSVGALHIDAVQAFGKLSINAYELGADSISISAHKIHGIKGAGALYLKKGVKTSPLIYGGGQEKGKRSGTEAVPAIAAFGAAVKAFGKNKNLQKVTEIRDYAIKALKNYENVIINSPDNALPYILNFSFLGYRSETLLHLLESENICVSSGSACSKGKGSYVLSEMGLDKNRIDSAIRLSFSFENELCDIDKLVQALSLTSFLKKA